MPMHALARFSEYPRVFTFFFSLDGRCRRHLFSLSCVGADFVAPSSQRSRGECSGKRSSAFFSRTSSRQHPRGNFPQFLPQDSRDGRCPGNLARSNVTLLRSPSFSGKRSSASFSRTSSRQHPRGNFPRFLPQDSRGGRCPGNLARSNVTLLPMSCEFCSLVAIFPSDIEFSPSKQTS